MSYLDLNQYSHVIVHKDQSLYVDKAANLFLKPLQYFWNGKKVELIEQESNKACQLIGSIYEERSMWKTAMMVLLFIPGTMLGIPLKKLTKYSDLSLNENQFIKKCLNKSIIGSLCTPAGQEQFVGIIENIITQNFPKMTSNNPCLDKEDGVITFSEITHLHLLHEENQWNDEAQKWDKKFEQSHLNINKNILNNIDLFWNIKFINFQDHYHASLVGTERTFLMQRNPQVQVLCKDKTGRNIVGLSNLSAKNFFANRK